MNVSLVDVDGHNFPNLALMKIAAWHKRNGDSVTWHEPLFSRPDRVYASKVFTFTDDYRYFPDDAEVFKGGTGYRSYTDLPPEIDGMMPDYSIYPQYDFAIGFLSRGCIRNCPWCVVPRKEGRIRQYDDIERVAQGRNHVVLMDNNFLANEFDFVKDQLTKAVRMKLAIDFNQGLDVRLVTPKIAALLARCRWRDMNGNNSYIRFSCDTQEMVEPLKNAVDTLRRAGYHGHVFVYILAKEVDDALRRVETLTAFDGRINPFIMPYRNLDGDGQVASDELKKLARWCNMAAIRKTIPFNEYRG